MASRSPVAVNVDATRALRNVKAGLRGASPELKREFYKGLNRATKALRAAAAVSAAQHLPRRGGMAARAAKTKMSTSSAGGGISIRTKRGASWEAGRLRHPVYGNRQVWVAQPVPPAWFTEPMLAGAPAVRRELLDVLDHVGREVAKRSAT